MKRYVIIDIFRAICALEIIVYWHMGNYVHIFPDFFSAGRNVTIVALCGFTFISGLCNGKSIKSYHQFIMRRWERLWIPYLVAYFCLVEIGLNTFTIRNCLLSLSGFCWFTDYQPLTLWYISMLLIYYAITPLIVSTKNTWMKLLKSIGIWCVMILFYLVFDLDYRIAFYLLFYLLGLNINISDIDRIISNKYFKVLSVLGVISIIMTFNLENTNNYILMYLLAFTGIPLYFLISKYLMGIKWVCDILIKIAYSSMFAYLFHRFLFSHICDLCFGISEYVLVPLLIFIVFVCSYYLQAGYDYVLRWCHYRYDSYGGKKN